MRIILITTTLLILFLPSLIAPLPRSFKSSLAGVTKDKKLPPLSYETILSGTFQSRFEKWFLRSTGLRPLLVKTDNQINYSVFKQLSSSRQGKAILGERGHLIEKIYIKRAQGALAPKKKKLRAKANEIAKMAKLLQTQGVAVAILISPNKPATFPEVIPNRFALPESVKASYDPIEILKEELAKKKIPTIDIAERFLKIRSQSKTKESSQYLFSHTGTHWSEYGSCLAVESLFKTMKRLLPEFSGTMNCSINGTRKLPLPIDRDLLSVANLWFPEDLIMPAPKVVRSTITNQEQNRPRVLFVGTSYLWALFYNLNKASFLSQRDMYYYFKRSVPYPKGKEVVIDRKDSRWIERALKSDLVVLEVNEAFPHRLGYGFPKATIKYLTQNQ